MILKISKRFSIKKNTSPGKLLNGLKGGWRKKRTQNLKTYASVLPPPLLTPQKKEKKILEYKEERFKRKIQEKEFDKE